MSRKQDRDRAGQTDRVETDRVPADGLETDRVQAGRAETDRAEMGRAETDRVQTGRAQEDRVQAGREYEAGERLLRLGADALGARPWRHASALDLVQFAVWRNADLGKDDVLSALALLPAARAEVEGLESALLFTARAAGLTWAQMADAMGFNSPQACQQHFTRLTARQDTAS